MKRRLIALAAVLLLLSACGGPAGEAGTPLPSGTSPVTSGPSPSGSFSPVYTDWSKLEPYRPDLGRYTRYYEAFTGHLLPVEGGYGGALIPFPGADVMDGIYEENFLFGLATADGTVVCDPAYEVIAHPSSYDRKLNRYVERSDFLILGRTFFEGDSGPMYEWQEYVYTVAAGDGSWVLEGEYRSYFDLSDGRLLLMDAAGGLWICGQDGTLTPSPLNEELPRRQEADWKTLLERSAFYDGAGVFSEWGQSGSWLLNAVTGEVKHLPDVVSCQGWWDGDPLAVARTGDLCGYLDRSGNWAIPPRFRVAREFEGNFAEVQLTSGRYVLIDRSGEVAVDPHGYIFTGTDRDGTVYYLDRARDEEGGTIAAVYDGEGRLLPDHPLTGLRATVERCAVTTAEKQVIGDLTVINGLMTIWDYDGTVLGTVEGAQGLSLMSCEDGKAMLHKSTAAGWSIGVYDLAAGAWIVPLDRYLAVQTVTDGTDTVYIAWLEYGEGGDILGEDGTLIAHADDMFGSGNGLIRVRDGGYSGFLDTAGNWVFRWPISINDD